MAGEEALQLQAVFFGEERAGGQEHAPAGFDRCPQRVEQILLLAGGFGRIGGAAQPFDVGIAAHHARSGAGYVGQHRVKLPAIIPRSQIPRVSGGQRGRLKAQAAQIVGHAFQTACVDVERGHPAIGHLQNMPRFAARRGAGIQDAFVVLRLQQIRCLLCAEVLHRHQAV